MTEKKIKLCHHELRTGGSPFEVMFLCQKDAGHSGLHRWYSSLETERARVWTDDGIDFLEGPYALHEQPDGITCNDLFSDPNDGTEIGCVRPKGHSGQHGNYHDEDSPTMWSGYDVLPAALAATPWGTDEGMHPLGAAISAHFEVVIANGIAKPHELRLNGMKLPNVRELTVEYSVGDARTVIVEIVATSVTEVPE